MSAERRLKIFDVGECLLVKRRRLECSCGRDKKVAIWRERESPEKRLNQSGHGIRGLGLVRLLDRHLLAQGVLPQLMYHDALVGALCGQHFVARIPSDA